MPFKQGLKLEGWVFLYNHLGEDRSVTSTVDSYCNVTESTVWNNYERDFLLFFIIIIIIIVATKMQ